MFDFDVWQIDSMKRSNLISLSMDLRPYWDNATCYNEHKKHNKDFVLKSESE